MNGLSKGIVGVLVLPMSLKATLGTNPTMFVRAKAFTADNDIAYFPTTGQRKRKWPIQDQLFHWNQQLRPVHFTRREGCIDGSTTFLRAHVNFLIRRLNLMEQKEEIRIQTTSLRVLAEAGNIGGEYSSMGLAE
jgi:hypothetical protein